VGVIFSKIKSLKHMGKQLAFISIFEKIAIGISPILGGVIAFCFGPQFIMWVSSFFFLIAALPLLKSKESIPIRSKIDFSGFSWRMVSRSIIAQIGIGFSNVAAGVAWVLFIVITIFPIKGNQIYLTLGVLSSVTFFVTIVTIFVYGKVIDKNKGGVLLKYSVVFNGLVHFLRPFIKIPITVVGVNIANEMATAGVAISNTRGVVDIADSFGYRIEYLSTIDAFAGMGGVLAFLCLMISTMCLGDVNGIKVFFFIAGFFILLAGTSNFRIYRK
jgi:hypothetical protein